MNTPTAVAQDNPSRNKRRKLWRAGAWGCGGMMVGLGVVLGVLWVVGSRVPQHYPAALDPLPFPQRPSGGGAPDQTLGGGLAGFASPYLGHTGSWDGKGGGMGGSSKAHDMDLERAMGLRWTFMPVYWSVMEPDGAVDLRHQTPAAWQALDAFVVEAKKRGLNILLQAPVLGGNAGGPPVWAGRREAGKSAPANMDAAADFAARLATRYCPGGVLATRQGWGRQFGVRAWELDNEPESYFTHWKGQAADYAEFVTKSAGRIKQVDPQAVIIAPAMAGGGSHWDWLAQALDARHLHGSPAFRQRAAAYSLGPVTDVVSFHLYEGLDTAFSGKDRTIVTVASEVRTVFEQWEQRVPGFHYARKREYWHTEGNFDFFGLMSPSRRAAWRFQFFTRAFAAGIRKVVVMDACVPEQIAVRTYCHVLPDPFPMFPALQQITVKRGQVAAFRHPQGTTGQVWVVWALANSGDATIELPVQHQQVQVLKVNGQSQTVAAVKHHIHLQLAGDAKMAPALLVLDTATLPQSSR